MPGVTLEAGGGGGNTQYGFGIVGGNGFGLGDGGALAVGATNGQPGDLARANLVVQIKVSSTKTRLSSPLHHFHSEWLAFR